MHEASISPVCHSKVALFGYEAFQYEQVYPMDSQVEERSVQNLTIEQLLMH